MDSEGAPVRGTTVMVVPIYYSRGGIKQFYGWALNDGKRDTQLHFMSVTNGLGVFEIRDIPYSGIAFLFVPGYGRVDDWLDLKSGEFSTVDIVLEDRPTLVKGRVLTSAGAPVTDAVVDLNNYRGEGHLLNDSVLAYTDKSGYFFLWLPGRGMEFFIVASEKHGNRTFLHVWLSEEELVTLRIEPQSTLSGHITWADGTPATDRRAVLTGRHDLDGSITFGIGYESKVKADESYRISDVSPDQKYTAYILSLKNNLFRRIFRWMNSAEKRISNGTTYSIMPLN